MKTYVERVLEPPSSELVRRVEPSAEQKIGKPNDWSLEGSVRV